MKVVCDTDPARPSAVVSSQRDGKKQSARPGISSDLDAIVLKAMRKEPEQRYASVDKFSEDIGNFLAARPVSAHQGSWRYVAGKFVRRHRTGVLMSAALALLLAVGISAVLWEVHVARVERVRAERHFNEVRKLANSVTFELHDSIKDLPGATPARKLIVDRALEYLDALSRETGNDLSLQHELAAAYEKVGDVQGYPFGANIGNTVGAINSYRKALAIRQSLLAKDPKNRVFQQELSGIYWKIGISLDGQADFTGALADLRKALALTEESGAAKDSARGSDQLAGDYRAIASVQAETGDLTGALGSYRQAASIREAAIAAYPADSVALRTHLAADYYGMSESTRSGCCSSRSGDSAGPVPKRSRQCNAAPVSCRHRSATGELSGNPRTPGRVYCYVPPGAPDLSGRHAG
jgi:tetratricopeptide (TPR) repeat protein